MSAASPSIVRGQCLCERVRFELEPPVKFCVHCHCSLCRRAHGAPLVTWTGVPAERLRITAGEDQLASYHSTPTATRRFCSHCGSSLFFEAERWPGEVHVAVANLVDPLPLAPQAHVFYSDHVEWLASYDQLPRLGGASGVAPLPPEPSADPE